MRTLAALLDGLRSLLRKPAVEREMDDELDAFLAASAADKQRQGMSPLQAGRAARIEMGSTNAVKHRIRSAGWETACETWWLDLRHGLRTLRRSPGFTLVAVLSLALGIGANTAIFTLLKQVMLQSLPVRAPRQLFSFGKSLGAGVLGGVDLGTADMFTYDFARQLEAQPGPFQGVAAYSSLSPKVSVRLANAAAAIQVNTNMVSGNFFSVLGATPMLGRSIASFDAETPDKGAVVVVSYRFWQQMLSADPAVLGKTISLNATPFIIIGVMPEAFHGVRQELEPPDLWVPITMVQAVMLQPGMLQPRNFYILHMIARISPQTPLATQQSWLDQQVHDYVRAGEGKTPSPERQQEIARISVKLVPAAHGIANLSRQYGESLEILMAIVAVVLLIACGNLANFLLARAVSRQRENVTRLALGSSRARIVRQSVIEALLLSFAGGVIGLGVALAVTRALISFVAQGSASTALDPRPDSAILLFTLAVSLLAGLLFGLAPALQISRSAAPNLQAGTRTALSAGGAGSRFWPKVLVASQITLCLLLLVGAGLFLRTLRNLQQQDLGFDRSHMLIAQIAPQLAGYVPRQAPALNQRLLERLSAIPGVRSAALAGVPPMSFSNWNSTFSAAGYTPGPREDMSSALNRVSGQYFETAGIRIVAGRAISPADTANSLKVAVVNETIARKFFPHGDAIGRPIKIDIDSVQGPWQIVGIARDSKSAGLRQEPERMIYLPLAQIVGTQPEGTQDSFAGTILLRTSADPEQAVNELRAAVASIDPNLPVLQVRTMQEHLETFMSNEELISRLTTLFAGLAVLLAAIGLYGVMTFNVARRTGEIGIRIALGASGSGVQWMVLRESLLLLLAGLGVGLPLALYLARLLRSQLYEMNPFDPGVFLSAMAAIALVTLLSAWLPARRAAGVDPMAALRCE